MLLAALLAGCASAPPPAARVPAVEPAPPLPAPPPGTDTAVADFVRGLYTRASEAESAGRLAEAAWLWEAAALAVPGDAGTAARLADLRRRIDEAVRARLPRAAAAQRRGELEGAAQLYLEVLALAPDHAASAEALRAIERERNKRSFIGRFSRQVLTRRAAAEAEMQLNDDPAPGAAARNTVEHATMLARQGDVDGAIAMLTEGGERPASGPAAALLADLYVQKAQALQAGDPAGARAAVDAALAIDRRHAGALALSRKLPRARAAGAAAPAASAVRRR